MIPFFAPRANLPISADSTGRYLPWLVAMMVFLAVLSLAGVLAVGGVLEDWRRDVSGTVTVQIAPATAADPTAAKAETDRRVTQALAILRDRPFVAQAEPLSESSLVALLEPWLGSSDLVSDLPLPRLIDVRLAEGARPDLAALAKTLQDEVPGASLDDHQVWLAGIIDLAEGLSLLGVVVVGWLPPPPLQPSSTPPAWAWRSTANRSRCCTSLARTTATLPNSLPPAW